MAKKTTKTTLTEILNYLETQEQTPADWKETLTHQIELLDKKSSKGNEKQKAETLERAEKVYAALAEMEKPVTLSELKTLTSDAEVADYHTSRLSALVRKLGDRVKREEIKGKAYFSVA